MNIETQHIEFKESWHDEFLKTLAAFANTEGGTMKIGIDDSGSVKGIANAKELLENLPNKIVQRLHIHPLVKYVETNGLATIEVVVEPYETAISYNGKFYIRTGSTTQELSDKELHRFLLKKNKITWESLTEDHASLDEIKPETIEKFKKLARKRVPNIEREDTVDVLKKLHLIDEHGKLKRAAILLFGKDPQKYFHSSYFKIGKFRTNTDLVTDDVIEGNLFDQFDLILNVLRVKYLSLMVKGYKDWVRQEELEYPEDALREAVINALIHKDYLGSHTQMKIFDDKIILWNAGELLKGITIADLKKSHESVLRNELICNAFYKAELIEAWGRGTELMVTKCKEAGLPEPEYREYFGGIELIFYKDRLNENALSKFDLNERQMKAIAYLKENKVISSAQYIQICEVSKRTAIRDLNLLEEKSIITKKGDNKNVTYILKDSI